MARKMKLKGQVTRKNGDLIFSSTLYDDTPFTITTTLKDLELKQELCESANSFEGLLYVSMEAQQDSRCYLTLPQPSLRHGKQIIVNRGQLLFFTSAPKQNQKPKEPVETKEN